MALYKGDIEFFHKLLQMERQKLKGSDKEKVSFSKQFKEDFKDIFVWFFVGWKSEITFTTCECISSSGWCKGNWLRGKWRDL